MCNTGAAKSAAYKIAVDDPLKELNAEIGGLAVQDYTRKGLMHHLVEHGGRAIIVYPEMSEFLDLVLKKQNDQENASYTANYSTALSGLIQGSG